MTNRSEGSSLYDCPAYIAAVATDFVLIGLARLIWPGLQRESYWDNVRGYGMWLILPLLLLWGLILGRISPPSNDP